MTAVVHATRRLVGGRLLGKGWHGETLDVHDVVGDDETVHARIRGVLSADITVWDASMRARRFPVGGAEWRRLLRSISRARTSVAKSLKDERVFMEELRNYRMVSRAYGKDTDAMTTLRPLRFGAVDVIGMRVRSDFYVFGSRCQTTIDNVDFDDQSTKRLVTHVLESLSRLHSGGVVHNDIKLANIMLCSSNSRKAKFKLIDWGGSRSVADIVRRVRSGVLSNRGGSKSPMAWLCWGAAHPAAAAAMFLTHDAYSDSKVLRSCADFGRLIAGAAASFTNSFLETKVVSTARRAKLARQYAPSFDTFNLGLCIAAIACRSKSKLNKTMYEALLDLSRRLTHYGDPDFTQDAAVALSTWRRVLRPDPRS